MRTRGGYNNICKIILHRTTGGGLNRPPFFVLDPSLPSSPSLPPSDDTPRLSGLDAKLAAIVTPTIVDLGYELVRVTVIGRDNPTVQIMADRADGAAMAVEDCESISRAVSAVLDVEDPIQGNWTLEVSSPGIDRPLTRVKDWNRYAGHQARLEMDMPVDGRRRFVGIILGADAEHARLRLDDGAEVTLPLEHMRRARLVLTDALIAATAAQPTKN